MEKEAACTRAPALHRRIINRSAAIERKQQPRGYEQYLRRANVPSADPSARPQLLCRSLPSLACQRNAVLP